MTLATFKWTDRARPIVELGIGDTRTPVGQAVWGAARWDDTLARWAGTEPTWYDITCDTFSYRCAYGRERTTDRFIVGTASVLVNNKTGWADPNVTPETGVLSVRPGRAIRMGVVHATLGVRWLFRGFVDAMTPTYHPTETDMVELACIDALGEVNRAKFVAQELAPPGETVTSRISRILDLAQWPATKRALWPTSDTLIADELDGQAADLLGQAADSGGGAVFGDLEGRILYRPRDWQTFPPGTPVDGTIGNVDPDDVCPTRWERPFSRSDIATRVIVGREQPPATGPAGPQGPSGSTGPAGPAGPAGAKGDPGQGFTYMQPTAPTGAKTGETWWNTANGVSYLFWNDGTSSQWVQFAPGADGVPGPVGPAGATGTPGVKGDPGATGAQGPQGVKGDTGTAGATGAAGPKGDPGTAGATGAQGPQGDPGPTGATGPAGAAGSGYTFKQDTTPTPTVAGQTWWNSSTGTLSGTTWVAVDRGGGVLVWVQDN